MFSDSAVTKLACVVRYISGLGVLVGGEGVARVFVSYASENIVLADEVRRWLDDDHHEVFLAQDLRVGIAAGEQWRSRLHEQLRAADALVCVVSSAYVASSWCTAEVAIAQSRGTRLIPILAEPGVVHPLLSDVQHIKLVGNSVTVAAALAEALRRVDASGGWGWPDGRSPFPGLRPLDVKNHRVFFGRTAEVEQLAGLLRSPLERAEGAVLLVIGPSGCGKSSLVRAGLLSTMAAEPGWWTLAPMLPGADPVAALVRELAAAGKMLGLAWTVAEVACRLENDGLTELVDEVLLAAGSQRLLLVVDQFEEVLTQATTAARARFAGLLDRAVGGSVQVVATLRPEFLAQLLNDAKFERVPTRLYPVRPLRRDLLHVVIEGPCRLAGIGVDEELVAQMVADTNGGEALPLLAFTLAQLAEGVTRGGQLSPRRYEQIGGVQGALTRQADAALTEARAATGRSFEQILSGLLRLVTVDEHGHPTRWRVVRDELRAPVIRELDAFVRRRLLTTDTDQRRVVVGVAHEAFLFAWAPLARAIQDNATALRAYRAIEQAAAEWSHCSTVPRRPRGKWTARLGLRRPVKRLWERGQLASALADTGAHRRSGQLVSDRIEFSPEAQAFLQASIRRDRTQRRRAVTVLSGLLILALIAGGIAVAQQRSAEHQRDLAISRQIADQTANISTFDPTLAMQLSVAAYQIAPTSQARSSLLSASALHSATRVLGESGGVLAVAVSPDGRTVAAGSTDGSVHLFDINNAKVPTFVSSLTDHTGPVRGVAFSPDGHILASGSEDRTVRIWDLSDLHHPSLIATLTGATDSMYGVAFSPRGHILASGSSDGMVRLWNLADPLHPALMATLRSSAAVRGVSFSPNGQILASGDEDRTVRLWNLANPHRPTLMATLAGANALVYGVAFSPDGHILASGSFDGVVRLWDLTNPQHPMSMTPLVEHAGAVYEVAFSPDGHILASGNDNETVQLWNLANPRSPTPVATLTGHTGSVNGVAFDPNGNTLVSSSFDGSLRLWDLTNPDHTTMAILNSHAAPVTAVGFSPDGHTLANSSADGAMRLWNLTDPHHPALATTLAGVNMVLRGAAFTRDGHILASGAADGTVRLWDLTDSHRPKSMIPLVGHAGIVRSVAFSSDGHLLASSGDDRTVRLWDFSNPSHPAPMAILTNVDNSTIGVAFSPDGRTLAGGATDDTIQLWDLTNSRHPVRMSPLTGHGGFVYGEAFSPDGHILASGSADATVRLWDFTDPRHPTPMATLTGHTGPVYWVAFSPDGRTLASGSYDRTVRLWDLTDPHHPIPMPPLTGHMAPVRGIAFSPDGRTLASGDDARTIRLWDTHPEEAIKNICSLIVAPLTLTQWRQYIPDLPYNPPCDN